jgi:hypothetical protein
MASLYQTAATGAERARDGEFLERKIPVDLFE